MVLKLFLFLLPVFLFSSEVVWDGEGSLSEAEYNQAIKEYVDKKYSEKVKAWNDEQIRKNVIREETIRKNTTTINALMWQDNKDIRNIWMNWNNAMAYCANLKLAGFDDWILPSKEQFEALYTNKIQLKNSVSDLYWSSSPKVSNSSYAWFVNFKFGNGTWDDKSHSNLVRCVRDSQ